MAVCTRDKFQRMAGKSTGKTAGERISVTCVENHNNKRISRAIHPQGEKPTEQNIPGQRTIEFTIQIVERPSECEQTTSANSKVALADLDYSNLFTSGIHCG